MERENEITLDQFANVRDYMKAKAEKEKKENAKWQKGQTMSDEEITRESMGRMLDSQIAFWKKNFLIGKNVDPGKADLDLVEIPTKIIDGMRKKIQEIAIKYDKIKGN